MAESGLITPDSDDTKLLRITGSLRDVQQQLAGHAGLNMTQRYIEGDTDAKRKIVGMV